MSRPFPEAYEYVPKSARFTNIEKDTIEILYQDVNSPDDIKIMSCVMPANIEYPPFKWVLENCDDLDNIHLNTFRWIKDERTAYENLVMEIAKRDGLICTSGLADVRSYKTFLELLFKPFDESKEAELNNLFSIKLELFEMPHIRQSTNNDLKKALRRAETPIDVVKAAIDIQLDNLANGIEIVEEDTLNTSQDSA